MSLPSFLSSRFVERDIDGQLHRFYPVSVRAVFKLRDISKPISKAIQALLTGNDDTSRESVKMTDKERNYQERVVVSAINPELARLRHQQKQDAIETLINGLLSEESSFVLADLIMDSMREAGFPKNPTIQQKAEFVNGTSATAMVEMAKGLAEANKELFRPLALWLESMRVTLKSKLAGSPAEPSAEPTPASGEQ